MAHEYQHQWRVHLLYFSSDMHAVHEDGAVASEFPGWSVSLRSLHTLSLSDSKHDSKWTVVVRHPRGQKPLSESPVLKWINPSSERLLYCNSCDLEEIEMPWLSVWTLQCRTEKVKRFLNAMWAKRGTDGLEDTHLWLFSSLIKQVRPIPINAL